MRVLLEHPIILAAMLACLLVVAAVVVGLVALVRHLRRPGVGVPYGYTASRESDSQAGTS